MRCQPVCIAALLVASLMLLLPSASMGQGTVPPDNSGSDQYTEGVPGPEGETPTTGGNGRNGGSVGGSPDSSNGASQLDPALAEALEAAGVEGEQLASIIAQTSPAPKQAADGNQAAGPEGASSPSGAAASQELDFSELSSVLEGGEGGMGDALPVILVGAALVAVGAAAITARRS